LYTFGKVHSLISHPSVLRMFQINMMLLSE
jgi:hypothetical protein